MCHASTSFLAAVSAISRTERACELCAARAGTLLFTLPEHVADAKIVFAEFTPHPREGEDAKKMMIDTIRQNIKDALVRKLCI